jgi:A/G-specific adenine glycosylase
MLQDMPGQLQDCHRQPIDMSAELCEWYRHNARDLPWRRQRNGYTALVSEIMLQQTQASRVIERFNGFMERFPTVRDLACADEQEVLALWQGLGYYRRARNLHAAAKQIVQKHGGRVPRVPSSLMSLPGIGRYTAGAIASIVFGERAAIVDGNVERVLARWFAHQPEGPSKEAKTWAWTKTQELIETTVHPGVFNEAIMELGATVCTPRNPACADCPAAAWCKAKQEGMQQQIPRSKPAARQQHIHHHAIIIRRGSHILFQQRPVAGMWSRMWQTPTIEATRPLRPKEVHGRLQIKVERLRRLARFVHQTTHRRVTFHVFFATSRARSGVWRKPNDVSDLPLSSPQQRIVRMAIEQSDIS